MRDEWLRGLHGYARLSRWHPQPFVVYGNERVHAPAPPFGLLIASPARRLPRRCSEALAPSSYSAIASPSAVRHKSLKVTPQTFATRSAAARSSGVSRTGIDIRARSPPYGSLPGLS